MPRTSSASSGEIPYAAFLEQAVPRMAIRILLTLWIPAAVADAPAPSGAGAADSPEAARPLLRRGAAGRSGDPSKDAATAPAAARDGGQAGGWLRTTLALAGVVALIVFLAWVSRRAGGLTVLQRPGAVQVVSRVTLAPRQTLFLVRIGTRMVLVGVSRDRLTALDVIDDADACARVAGAAEAARRGEFERKLAREEAAFEAVAGEGGDEEQLSPRPARIAGVQDQIQAALRRIEGRRSA